MRKLFVLLFFVSSYYSFADLKKFQCDFAGSGMPYNVQLATFPNLPNKLLIGALDPNDKKQYKKNAAVEPMAKGFITVKSNGTITGNMTDNREPEYDKVLFKNCVSANFSPLIEGEGFNPILIAPMSKYLCEYSWAGTKIPTLVQISNIGKLPALHFTPSVISKTNPYEYQQGYTMSVRGMNLDIDEAAGLIVLHNGDAMFSKARFSKCVKAEFKSFF